VRRSYWKAFFWKLAHILAFVGMFVTALLTVINFGFYGFKGQSRETRQTKQVGEHGPVLHDRDDDRLRVVLKEAESILSIVVMALVIRGSLGTFPLRIQSYSVTKNAFINATVPNGMA